jgi:hypothetical protein
MDWNMNARYRRMPGSFCHSKQNNDAGSAFVNRILSIAVLMVVFASLGLSQTGECDGLI